MLTSMKLSMYLVATTISVCPPALLFTSQMKIVKQEQTLATSMQGNLRLCEKATDKLKSDQ